MAKRVVLCFGDSNTWGYDPSTRQRFSDDVRWTGVLQRELGMGYRVVEEGLCGRTTVVDDPLDVGRNGSEYLPPCLESHQPIDIVVLMLGTNDMKNRFSLSPSEIARGAAALLESVRTSRCGPGQGAPSILLISPPLIEELPENAETYQGGRQKSQRLAEQYRLVAQQFGAHFLNAASVITVSELDGVHLDASAHGTLGCKLADDLREILADA